MESKEPRQDRRGRDSYYLSLVGEQYVILKLLQHKIRCDKLSIVHDYDLLTEDGVRIEVKTSSPAIRIEELPGGTTMRRTSWNFVNFIRGGTSDDKKEALRHGIGRDRNCDFYAFVCMDEQGEPERTYIVPNAEIGTLGHIAIEDLRRSSGNGSKYGKYKDAWWLLTTKRLDQW